MTAWSVLAASAPSHAAQRLAAGVIGHVGDARFAAGALSELHEVLASASWSVYQVWPDRPPVLHLSASLGVPDTTHECFAAYRGGLYRRDRSFEAVKGASPGHAAVLRMHAEQAPNSDHRDIIYRRHRILERLSVAALQDDGSLLAVNVYRHEPTGRFGEAETAAFVDAAMPLLASVRRHLALAAPPASPREMLRRRYPALTERELDVCERVLRGWSYDGIAADLGLSVATVKTYRARAFERLGLHFRSQLFALVQPGRA